MKRSDIKAVVTYSWSHPRSKFFPGHRVKVDMGLSNYYTLKNAARTYGKAYAGDHGREGVVIAASCGPDGRLRSRKTTWYGRCYTRYYVEFGNGDVRGYHSNHLEKI